LAPGTVTPSSADPSPRMSLGHLQPLTPSTMPRPPAPYSPHPQYMRPGSTPSPAPMPWIGGYYQPPPGACSPYPYPVWMAPGTPGEGPPPVTAPNGNGSLPSSRSPSPFVLSPHGPPPAPFMGYSPGQFYAPPPGVPYPPPPPQFLHPLAVSTLPPAPNAHYTTSGRQNSLPGLPPIPPRSRRNTSTSAVEDEDEDEVSDELMEAIFKNPESMKASSIGSGRSSRAGSQTGSQSAKDATGEKEKQ